MTVFTHSKLIPFNQSQRFLWIFVSVFVMILGTESLHSADESLYNPRGKRDPFMPLVSLNSRSSGGITGVENEGDVVIEGIVYDAKKGSVVIVNGVVLRSGDEVGSVKVLKIQPEGALFLINGAEVYKAMYKEDSKGASNT